MDYLDVIKEKIITDETLGPLLTYWRLKDNRIVFTNGCFDILHRGHIEYLSKTASLGDIVVVGLNSDRSVRKIKGNDRPLQDEYSRALVMASLKQVTGVYLFDEETPYNLITRVKPDVLVKGGDYKVEEIVGADVVKAYGGEVVTIDFLKGYSTSGLIEKLQKTSNK
ncbi:MAG: D-glycero-beta-D-manno-heptose 1-phosphate adenylyltransferase [Bacteroidales bacterium]|nr:D-glycero-beta-D-manno-heptose 1-phosphate adenylyltransferase [Bacteroidales bacterium]MBS3774567.1 D-glycero-beta-D-manno-heptose 1-phosphate adenylyltransferase [Bacteroidales bacterium]